MVVYGLDCPVRKLHIARQYMFCYIIPNLLIYKQLLIILKWSRDKEGHELSI